MTNEIKEIQERLDYHKAIGIEPEYCEDLITTGELQRLLDYITNLQEENNELKQIIDIRECQLEEMQMNKTDYTQVNILEMQLEDYKSRNEKAIEYINKFEDIKAYYSYEENGYEEYNYDEDFKEDLLNILRGKDEVIK